MAPQDALKILDAVCSQVQMNRAQHVECQRAVEVIMAAIIKVDEPK